jgi:hypothetical protein
MIYTAIEALKEQNGSSKRAIAKYIEHVYKDQLPPSHTTLLTHHLKRLKSDGLLSMVKNSYIIPRSTPPLPSSSPPQPSRPRGRPRKPQSQSQPLPPPIIVTNNNNNSAQQQPQNAEPVWAALGLADEPAPVSVSVSDGTKRGRGRPKKATGPNPSPSPIPVPTQEGGAVIPPTPSRGRGRPPGSKAKSKRRPGRPPKVQPETTTAAAVVSGGAKKRPGRPAKNQKQNPTPIPFAAPVSEVVVPTTTGVEGVAVLTPRSRGRPRKNNSAVAAVPVAVVAPAGRGRGRGRGRGGGGRGRGRGGVSVTVQARPAGKRPVGRPKKVIIFKCVEIDNFVIFEYAKFMKLFFEVKSFGF